MNRRQRIGWLLGPGLFLLLIIMPTPEGMSSQGMMMAAVTALMAVFWICEVIPIPATALLPIALFPLLGIMPASKVTLSYANHLIYLFMGGFLIAIAIEKWGLHRRIALHTVRLVGLTPSRIVLGFMLATAFLSCWISNTATAMLMTTIGIAVLHQAGTKNEVEHQVSNFGVALMLGIAYAASIGGVATLIGTPPNAILAGVVEKEYGHTISFAEWMLFAAPLSLLMLMITWVYLTRVAFPLYGSTDQESVFSGGKTVIQQQLSQLGVMSKQEKRVLVVFLFVVVAWLFRGLLDVAVLKEVQDSTVAIIGALLLFMIPANLKQGEFLLDWQAVLRMPWDIIILFGGGFALASGFSATGLTEWLGGELTLLHGAPPMLMVAAVVLLVIFLTEVTSNTATASLLLPVMAGFALASEVPAMVLMGAVALAASFAFMLPVATPPNAIVFSSRQVTIPQMARAGFWLNIVGVVLITLFVMLLLPLVMAPPG